MTSPLIELVDPKVAHDGQTQNAAMGDGHMVRRCDANRVDAWFNAYRLRLDVEQTVGYFFGNFGSMFTVLVLFGVLLYGAVALASGRKQSHRSTLPASIRKRYIVMTVISAAVYIPMPWLVFVRPLGDLASILGADALIEKFESTLGTV